MSARQKSCSVYGPPYVAVWTGEPSGDAPVQLPFRPVQIGQRLPDLLDIRMVGVHRQRPFEVSFDPCPLGINGLLTDQRRFRDDEIEVFETQVDRFVGHLGFGGRRSWIAPRQHEAGCR